MLDVSWIYFAIGSHSGSTQSRKSLPGQGGRLFAPGIEGPHPELQTVGSGVESICGQGIRSAGRATQSAVMDIEVQDGFLSWDQITGVLGSIEILFREMQGRKFKGIFR